MLPRIIDPAQTFEALVNWFASYKWAPGFLVGLSGTDSLVAFCAAATALERLGQGHRMMGVHFAPSEDFLYDHPEAEVHLWFANEVVPWLRNKFPNAEIVIDSSIDWRADGQRWGALMDLSVVSNDRKRMTRLPEDQYWVVGTRNRTEDVLLNYSNASMAVSLQPLIHLWKSEILQLSEYLDVPKIAVVKSCETDCICGRMRLPAMHIREVDLLLMTECNELSEKYVVDKIPEDLRLQLTKFINSQVNKHLFKKHIPYTPMFSIAKEISFDDPLVVSFEAGSLKLNEFNHYKHLYIAWAYLKKLNLEACVERYSHYLQAVLDANGQARRFSLDITRKYFKRLEEVMKLYPADTFEELVEKSPEVLSKISA